MKCISYLKPSFVKDHFMSPDEYEDPSVLYEAITTHEKVRNFLVHNFRKFVSLATPLS